MFVVCIEGCHGSGKTGLTKRASEAGFKVFDEAFLDMPAFTLHPQTLVMENLWVAEWFKRLLQAQKDMRKAEGHSRTIYWADRSPFSAVFYAQEGGELLEPLIQAQLEQLKKHDIHVITVYLQVEQELLWERIQERLKREPMREAYNESSREWMEKTVGFYESKQHVWDMTIQNNTTLADLWAQVNDAITEQHPKFKQTSDEMSSSSSEISSPMSPQGKILG